jgi:glycosyltransferase involved in cell wall biosynthesis
MLLVIVPTLNSHLLLDKLVKSLQDQSYSKWSLLFVDGASGDSHRNWLDHCCEGEPRGHWIHQTLVEPGIFGAMNHGFSHAGPADWLMFWGSDDWAATPTVLAEVAAALETAVSNGEAPDLLVCSGRYADAVSGSLGRATVFQATGLLDGAAFRRALLLGSTPPHQATLFGPGARQRLASYSAGFRLSADLDYFLQLSRHPDLRVQCLDLELVHMADGGVSGQQTQRRLKEVRRAYRSAFGWYWWFPFLMRYLRRVASLLERSR